MRRFEIIQALESSDSFIWDGYIVPRAWLLRNGEHFEVIACNKYTGKILLRRPNYAS